MGQIGQNIVSGRIKEAREKADFTQDDLSKKLAKLGVSIDRAGIAKIETGIRGVLDFEVVGLAKALNVKASWLLGVKE